MPRVDLAFLGVRYEFDRRAHVLHALLHHDAHVLHHDAHALHALLRRDVHVLHVLLRRDVHALDESLRFLHLGVRQNDHDYRYASRPLLLRK